MPLGVERPLGKLLGRTGTNAQESDSWANWTSSKMNARSYKFVRRIGKDASYML
jgi:hypothetical protein